MEIKLYEAPKVEEEKKIFDHYKNSVLAPKSDIDPVNRFRDTRFHAEFEKAIVQNKYQQPKKEGKQTNTENSHFQFLREDGNNSLEYRKK